MDHRFLIPMMGIIYGNIIFSVIHYYLNESNTKDLHQSLSFIIMRLKKQLIDKELRSDGQECDKKICCLGTP